MPSLRLLIHVAIATFATCSVVEAQLIIAHRGASHDAPENTLAAFKLAWKRGSDGIEGDFFLSKDGEIVCIHDKTTERTAPGQPKLIVAESTLEELRELDVGSWKGNKFAGEKPPVLQEVLATVPPGKQIFIEIKCGAEVVPVLKRILRDQSDVTPEQITIISFHQDVVAACRQQMPELKVNWLTGYKRENETAPWKPSPNHVIATLRRLNPTGLGTKAEPAVVNRRFVAEIRRSGLEFHCWTVNDIALARRFVELGVDSITTDRPAFIREAIAVTADAAAPAAAAP